MLVAFYLGGVIDLFAVLWEKAKRLFREKK
jgi:hypothetical protein